jgi:hypothetical protein
MATPKTGTFTGTGNSAVVISNQCAFDLAFAGAATVNIQWQLDGTNWRTLESLTATGQYVYDGPRVPLRLNCSAYTNDVVYAIFPGD